MTYRYFAIALTVFACSTESSRRAESDTSARMALAYRPSDTPTGRRIAAAQSRLRTQPSVARYLDLAGLLLRRRRETSAPIFMTYAQNAVDAALAMAPDNAHALLLRGLGHQYAHRFGRAAATAQNIIRQHPERADAYHLLGDAKLELGQYDEAIAAYQAAMDRRPDLRAYNRAAYVTWLHGGDDEAIRLLDGALDAGSQRDPEASAWCFVDLGEIYRHRGDSRRAMAAADHALSRLADYVPALLLRARAQAAAGNRSAALADYRQVLARLPSVEALLETADLLEEEGDAASADRRRAQAQALAPTDPRPMAHDWARRNVRPAEALRLATMELRDRQGIFAWDTYGLALIRVGRLEEAARALDKAQALNGPFAEFRLHRALLAVARGDRARAQAELKAALRMNPTVDRRLVRQIKHALEPRAQTVAVGRR